MTPTIRTALPAALRDHARGPSTDYTHGLMRQAAAEIERLCATLIEAGAIAAMCQHELQGRLVDDEHKRAFRALEKIKETCRS